MDSRTATRRVRSLAGAQLSPYRADRMTALGKTDFHEGKIDRSGLFQANAPTGCRNSANPATEFIVERVIGLEAAIPNQSAISGLSR